MPSTYTNTQEGGIKFDRTDTGKVDAVVCDFTASDDSLDVHFLRDGEQNLSGRQLFEKQFTRSQAGIWQIENDGDLETALEKGTYQLSVTTVDTSELLLISGIANGSGTMRVYLYDSTTSRVDPARDIREAGQLNAVSDINEDVIT